MRATSVRRRVLAAACALSAALAAPAMAEAGVYHVAPTGSDHGPGTAERPWRTLEYAEYKARAGDTVILRPGTYGALGTTTDFDADGTVAAPITFRANPDERSPRILGHARVTGNHVHLRHLLFDGPTGRVDEPTSENPLGQEVQLAIYGDGVVVAHCEVRDNLYHAGIYLDEAYRVRLVSNYIHHNGNFHRPAEANLDHGIYFGRGSGLIADNVIASNRAHGVQIYPYASRVLVTQNTIVRNGKAGVLLGADAAHNLIVNNVVAYNRDSGIRSHDLAGNGNAARHNLVFGNAAGNLGPYREGIAMTGNILRNPRFVSLRNWRLRPSSPAIDAALARWSLWRARLAKGRGPDLGALESR